MKAMRRPNMSPDQLDRVRRTLADVEHQMVDIDSYLMTLKVSANWMIALNDLYGFGAVRLSRLIKEVGDVSNDLADWCQDLGDDEMLYRRLRQIGLDTYVEAIEAARAERARMYKEWEEKFR